MGSMHAVVFRGRGLMEIEDVPRPEPRAGGALLRVRAASICATDLRIVASGHPRVPDGTPRILGHELAGEIAVLGEGVKDLQVGDHVGVAPNIGCGSCRECLAGWTNLCPDYRALGISLDGAFAEYMLIPAEAIRQGNVVRISDQTPPHLAALAEPLSCCLNGQEAVAVGTGDIVLIIGAGPIGVMHILLAKLRGAEQVIVSEISPTRLQQARVFGAGAVVNPKERSLAQAVLEITGGRGPDVVIVAAPSPEAQAEALELSARRGRIVFFGGLPPDTPSARLNTNLIHYRQLVVTGTTGSTTRQYRAALEMIVEGRIPAASLAGARLPLEQFREGFDRSRSASEMRIVLEPGSS
jgi:L-iditol 2-dehydrogenase